MAQTLTRLLLIVTVASLLAVQPRTGHAAPRGQTDAPTHEVQPGETLSEIAKEYGVTLERLMLFNGVDDADAVMAGQRLILPPEAIVTPPAPTTTATISASVTMSDAVTNPDGAAIDPSLAPNMSPAAAPSATTRNRRYTVESGDTLAGIAARTGVDTRALAALNPDVDDSRLRAGQELILPATAADLTAGLPAADRQGGAPTTQMTVAPGDSLSAIAARTGVSLPDLMRANALVNPDDLVAGQTLLIPSTPVATAAQADDAAPDTHVGPARRGFYSYTVRPGDTLSEIAKAFNTPMLAILEYNDLPDTETVYAGLDLRIPFGAPPLPMAAPPVPHSGTSFLVSLSRQQCWLFHGDTAVRTWNCSTGYGEWITRTGTFAVQTKLDMAKSGAYRLDMPYWLGIYDVGEYENGIHGIPVSWDTNEKLWDGLIGQPATFGCAMLGDEDAAELYKIAYLGMPVHIIP
ncbi:MAG: LysM peptidoglycan-binding domain-containing protein [Caldilineaceae bacterium]|nr:LysM peptidoglycan-binding domain-containing protein [Caldilineaceae bacterium]